MLEKEKKETLEKAENERLEAERLESLKDDEEKINDAIKDLEDFKTKYQFDNEKNQKMFGMVGTLIEKTKKYILQNKA